MYTYQPNLFSINNQPNNPYFNSQPNTPNMQVQQNFNKSQFYVKQVSSIEEARNFIIDAFSSYLFVDYNSGRIYLKRMNNNGCADFFSFKIEEPEQKQDPFYEINARLSNIESRLGGVNVQSVSNNAESNSSNDTASNVANATAESTGISKSARNDAGKK